MSPAETLAGALRAQVRAAGAVLAPEVVPAREGVLLGACGALLDPSSPPIAMQATERPMGEQEMTHPTAVDAH